MKRPARFRAWWLFGFGYKPSARHPFLKLVDKDLDLAPLTGIAIRLSLRSHRRCRILAVGLR